MCAVLKDIAIIYKNQILSKDLSLKRKGIIGIKESLETIESDIFTKIILDHEIQSILLHLLIKSSYTDSPDILKCFEYLCSRKIYFSRDNAVQTANIVLKNMYNLINDDNNEQILIDSLKIITYILENLNDYKSIHNIQFKSYLDITHKLLQKKKNSVVISTVIHLFSALLLYNNFLNIINDDILVQIKTIWYVSLDKLAEIFQYDIKNSVTSTSKLCNNILRLMLKIRIYQKDTIEKFYLEVQPNVIYCLKSVCIPYFREHGLTSGICKEYLCFLKTILKYNFDKNIIDEISHELVNFNNFTVIVKYLEESTEIVNIRELCLLILCEIVVNINHTKTCLTNIEKNKKYLFKTLQSFICYPVSDWLNILGSNDIDFESKMSIIKFCTTYYITSENYNELKPEHLASVIEFLNHIPIVTNVEVYFLKDLWLIFAALNYLFPEDASNNSLFYMATLTLERLISANKSSFDDLITYHFYIINWIFRNQYVKKDLIFAVVNSCLMRFEKDTPLHNNLEQVVCQWPKAATLFLGIVEDETSKYACSAAYILQHALKTGKLKSPSFIRQLRVAVPANLLKLKHNRNNTEKIKTCLYLLRLSSYIQTTMDLEFLSYSSQAITICLSSIGLSKNIPPFFYTNVFDYINNILKTAKIKDLREVFLLLMKSKPMLLSILMALASDEQEMSHKACEVFNNLLDYQISNRIYCETSLLLKKDYLIKLLCVTNIQQLQLNLHILKTLLFKRTKTLLALEIDEEFIKGLYFRCLNLVTKPASQLSMDALNCMEGILKYAQMHNILCIDYLCNQPGNHVIVMIFYDKDTSRPVTRTLLSFIQYWLQLSLKYKEYMYNKLSITSNFWNVTLYQIADIILGDTVESKSDNIDLINSILRQLNEVHDLLPEPIVTYIRSVEENENYV